MLDVSAAAAALIAAVAGVAAGLAGAGWMIRRAARGRLPVDLPDDRRLHTTPTPRGGGIGLPVAGMVAAAMGALAASSYIDRKMILVVLIPWALTNGALGYVDDHHPLRSRVKFAIQLAAAVGVVWMGLRLETVAVPPLGSVELGSASWPISVLWLVWTANVYNFMDGMDALAAASGVLFWVGLAGLAFAAGVTGLAVAAVGMAAGLAGFLRYNAPPARIFMGDAGSLFVGAALGGFCLALARHDLGSVPITSGVLLMGTFVWDATFTIIRRLLRGDAMLPHRTHLYQRLALAGWPHRRVRAVYLALAALMAVGAVLLPGAPRAIQAAIIAASVAGVLALTVATYRLEAARR